MSRVTDRWTNSTVLGGEELWIRDGWARKLGMSEDRYGRGETPDQVRNFPSLNIKKNWKQTQNLSNRIQKQKTEEKNKKVCNCTGNTLPKQSWKQFLETIPGTTSFEIQLKVLPGWVLLVF